MTVTVPAATPVVTTSKVAVFVPDGTTALAGTDAPLFADRETVIPPVGALADSVTVPVESAPLTTDAGDTATELSVWARTGPAAARLHSAKSARIAVRRVENGRCNRPAEAEMTWPNTLVPPYARFAT